MVSDPAIWLFGWLSFRSVPTISLRNGHEAGGPERSLLADGADVGGVAMAACHHRTERSPLVRASVAYLLRAAEWIGVFGV